MKIFLATNNGGKIERFKKLLKEVDMEIEVFSAKDLNIEAIDIVENGKTLAENAKLKANAYFEKVDMPILANDTGFYVEGEGFIDAPKRVALGDVGENNLSREEISEMMLNFWKGIATKYGGKVDAAWVEAFVLLNTDGKIIESESRREVLLTNQEFGSPHADMPVRALYYSKMTGKPAILHTEEEELLEMKPIIDALKRLLNIN
jgi:hypothetical protein